MVNSYEIEVENLGRIIVGESYNDATVLYNNYVNESKNNSGLPAGGNITLLNNGNVMKSYIGTLHQ